VPEHPDSVGDPGSDPEDGSYCGLEDLTEYDYSFSDADFATTLRAVLKTLQASSGFVPPSIIEGIVTRLELEELQRQKKTDIPRKQHRARSLSSSLTAEPHTFTQFIHGMELLPTELIYSIISFARPSDQHIHITLSQVNRFFRSLVNSSPLLWTKINLPYPIPLISLYIERSASSPLEIIADNGASSVYFQATERQERTSACLALLRPHRHRIHRLRVRDVDAVFWGLDMRNMVLVPQPRPDPGDNFLWCSALCDLETLDLDFSEWDIYGTMVLPPVTNLRRLRLCGGWSPTFLPLFAPQLESLSLGDYVVELSTLLDVLRRTPALEHLVLSDFLITTGSVPAGPPPVILERLQRLSFIRCLARGSRSVLQNIYMPQLSVLTIHFKNETGSIGASPSDQAVYSGGDGLFAQAQPNIQQLDISSFPANDTSLETTLQRVPGLTDLRIASSSLHDDQLLLLSVGGTSDVSEKRILCPRLTSLTVENEFNITSSAIRQIAASRHSASIPLKSLTLRGLDGTKISIDDIEGLEACGITELITDVFYPEYSGERDEDTGSGSEGEESSESDWLSGDSDVVAWGR
ncbi:hypothetical protein FRC01_006082, partial [Tulasnella sp. 417]